jgi:hypothetical protein
MDDSFLWSGEEGILLRPSPRRQVRVAIPVLLPGLGYWTVARREAGTPAHKKAARGEIAAGRRFTVSLVTGYSG